MCRLTEKGCYETSIGVGKRVAVTNRGTFPIVVIGLKQFCRITICAESPIPVAVIVGRRCHGTILAPERHRYSRCKSISVIHANHEMDGEIKRIGIVCVGIIYTHVFSTDLNQIVSGPSKGIVVCPTSSTQCKIHLIITRVGVRHCFIVCRNVTIISSSPIL